MNHSEAAVSTLFDRDADNYNSLRRRLIPCFDDFYGTALQLIRDWHRGQKLEVLDIGSGTGLFSAMVLEEFPVQRVALLDGSSVMLEQASQRLGEQDGLEFRLANMAEAELGGPWDIVISALAIHHLTDNEKRDLYHRIRKALKPGGLFVNAEQVAGPGPAAEDRHARIWLQQIRHLGVPEHEIKKAHERMAHDKCATLNDQLLWLEQAAFSDVDCSFKSWRFAVFSGRA
ncbi:class I SAM-dependent methyltransferase [Rhizobium gallicum]|uniref:class I SAM-dependent methyltransferase n=1 Tax=Rhizobium gallicum TaxID=56730 RepID=UPI001EF7A560|nr:class I SAM-dependent methyltransferase [Rhizobium gallicum]ULJ72388.1 class I SAM-dependent methyltransferase [Rhizobium gallicum]